MKKQYFSMFTLYETAKNKKHEIILSIQGSEVLNDTIKNRNIIRRTRGRT